MRITKEDLQKRYEELRAERLRLLDIIKRNEEAITLLKGRHQVSDDFAMAASRAVEAAAHVATDLRIVLVELWRHK